MNLAFDQTLAKFANYKILEYKIRQRSKEQFGKIIAQVEDVCGKYAESRGVVRTIWFISIDLIQNVYKYGVFDQWLFTNNYSLFFVENEFLLMTQNIIKTINIESVKSRIDSINQCFDKTDCDVLLNQKYKEKLQERPMPKEGASLGLIDVARKSENRLLYLFETIDAENSMFTILVRVQNKQIF
jgi:hypothetical protein